ncbi:MAG: hypothetical protein GWO02_05890 [Gammaproteobacteria bacterium]|nr:hypothetical protein [Gammaproteobacteria bacterium]
MVGKKNVVFGFLYLVLTAALGPYMVVSLSQSLTDAGGKKQEVLGEIQLMKSNQFMSEETLETMSGAQIAKKNTDGLLAINGLINAEMAFDQVKANPHAHGNLESLLNIAAGLVLGLVAVSAAFKQLISWCFILGALLHSGMLYLRDAFGLGWAAAWLESPLGFIGPLLILLGLLLAGIAAWAGYRGEPVRD